ncbi:hypothetical protein OSB04_021593 [Centaurea solstitialis]|uniref:glutathione transferase n=1 Tax=Centaurea solstitialis TaxID=347529 RepID=A0AA38WEB5_9ASTR|nr:hypothetical protein OSB04_021593 [Centaurea solstitialis]
MAKKGEIKLLGTRGSNFVNRVQIALNLKCVDYEFIDQNLDTKSDLLLKSNPVHKKVPVLLYGNEPPVVESLIILEYIDEIFPDVHPILPCDPSHRATIALGPTLLIQRYYYNCNNLSRYLNFDQFLQFIPLFDDLRLAANKEEKDEVIVKIRETAKMLEQVFVEYCSDGKAYFGGDDIGYLDIALGCFLGWVTFHQTLNNFKVFDDTITPSLVEWAKTIRVHEAISKSTPDKRCTSKTLCVGSTCETIQNSLKL